MESPDHIIPEYQNCAINFDDLKHKTPNTLIIFGSTSHSGGHYKFEIEYTGIELIMKKGFIPENVLSVFKDDLYDIFGYAPFDKKRINSKFKKLERWMYSYCGDSVTRK
ncbi:hypothetical protein COJ07_10345 [Bacillus cereus]|uniref:hypothetical protein n=1 Tax=Bacillus cereus TaxID=1396 RepID=UPI000BF9D138|nr:hypothetical protein [Bacillus cereus]PFL21678.1 hypothetical protein COJ07_10345 [Bacillus cereus]